MSNRLNNYTGQKYTFTVGEIAARGDLADDLHEISFTFANNVEFMSGDDAADILADFTGKLYISMTPASGDLEGDFIATLTGFWNQRKGDYKNMFDALTASYDPIQNYKMSESGIDGKRLDKTTDTNTRTGKAKTTETPTGITTTTTTPSGGTKTTETPTGTETQTETETAGRVVTSTESRTTYDDTSTWNPTVKTETTDAPAQGYEKEKTTSFDHRETETKEEYLQGTNTTVTESFTSRKTETETEYTNLQDNRTITHDNDKSGTVNGKSVSNAAEINEHYFERAGNIGVTTSQQMITSELELRYLYNLRYMFMREFITRFTY